MNINIWLSLLGAVVVGQALELRTIRKTLERMRGETNINWTFIPLQEPAGPSQVTDLITPLRNIN